MFVPSFVELTPVSVPDDHAVVPVDEEPEVYKQKEERSLSADKSEKVSPQMTESQADSDEDRWSGLYIFMSVLLVTGLGLGLFLFINDAQKPREGNEAKHAEIKLDRFRTSDRKLK